MLPNESLRMTLTFKVEAKTLEIYKVTEMLEAYLSVTGNMNGVQSCNFRKMLFLCIWKWLGTKIGTIEC